MTRKLDEIRLNHQSPAVFAVLTEFRARFVPVRYFLRPPKLTGSLARWMYRDIFRI